MYTTYGTIGLHAHHLVSIFHLSRDGAILARPRMTKHQDSFRSTKDENASVNSIRDRLSIDQ